ncbi:MAG: hypothetical protein SFT90_01280 [Rickettsiales bacterium]|nr:hypothetical protein [Rickettsiales bacterium]
MVEDNKINLYLDELKTLAKSKQIDKTQSNKLLVLVREYEKLFDLYNDPNKLICRLEGESDISTRGKLLVAMNIISDEIALIDPKSSDGKPKRKTAPKGTDTSKLEPIYEVATNHPTNPHGHKATKAVIALENALFVGDARQISQKVNDYLKIPSNEINKKRTTEESRFVISEFAKVNWYSDNDVVIPRHWNKDSDGNPNKTIDTDIEDTKLSNLDFVNLVKSDLINIVKSKNNFVPEIVDYLKELTEQENNIDGIKNIVSAKSVIDRLTEISAKNPKVKDSLDIIIKRAKRCGSYVAAPQLRQEGEIFNDAYQDLITKITEIFGDEAKVEDYHLFLDDEKNICAKLKNDESAESQTLFKYENFKQKTDGKGEKIPLSRDEVKQDHIAKLVYYANANMAEKSGDEGVVKEFVLSELKSVEHMANSLRLMQASGIKTKDIKLYPLVEEINNYTIIKNLSDLLKTDPKDFDALNDDQKILIKHFIESEEVGFLLGTSDLHKRGGAPANSQAFNVLRELCDSVVIFNKNIKEYKEGYSKNLEFLNQALERNAEFKGAKIACFGGCGLAAERGGNIDFMRQLASIAGKRGVEFKFLMTLQGEGVNRVLRPDKNKAFIKSQEQERNFQFTKEQFTPEHQLFNDFQNIWEELGKDLKTFFGTDVNGFSGARAPYQDFSEGKLDNEGNFITIGENVKGDPYHDYLMLQAKLMNTSDRPDSRKEYEFLTAYYVISRAIGYNIGARFGGDTNVIKGYGETLKEAFKNPNFDANKIREFYQKSTTFQTFTKMVAACIGMVDDKFMDKFTDILKDSPYFANGLKNEEGSLERKNENAKNEMYQMAKFVAISFGEDFVRDERGQKIKNDDGKYIKTEFNQNSDPKECFEHIRRRFSKHLHINPLKTLELELANDNKLELDKECVAISKQVTDKEIQAKIKERENSSKPFEKKTYIRGEKTITFSVEYQARKAIIEERMEVHLRKNAPALVAHLSVKKSNPRHAATLEQRKEAYMEAQHQLHQAKSTRRA